MHALAMRLKLGDGFLQFLAGLAVQMRCVHFLGVLGGQLRGQLQGGRHVGEPLGLGHADQLLAGGLDEVGEQLHDLDGL